MTSIHHTEKILWLATSRKKCPLVIFLFHLILFFLPILPVFTLFFSVYFLAALIGRCWLAQTKGTLEFSFFTVLYYYTQNSFAIVTCRKYDFSSDNRFNFYFLRWKSFRLIELINIENSFSKNLSQIALGRKSNNTKVHRLRVNELEAESIFEGKVSEVWMDLFSAKSGREYFVGELDVEILFSNDWYLLVFGEAIKIGNFVKIYLERH